MREMYDIHGTHWMYRKGSCGWGWFCFRLLNIWAQHVLVSLLQSQAQHLPRCLDTECQVAGSVPSQFLSEQTGPIPGKTELERGRGRGTCVWRVSNMLRSTCCTGNGECQSQWSTGEGGWEKSNQNLLNCMLHFSFFFFPIWKTILNFKPVLQLLLVFVTCRFNKHLPQFPIYITDVSTGQFQVQDRALWSCLLEIKPWTSFCEQACGSQCPAALPQSHIKKTSISNLLLRSPCEMALKA